MSSLLARLGGFLISGIPSALRTQLTTIKRNVSPHSRGHCTLLDQPASWLAIHLGRHVPEEHASICTMGSEVKRWKKRRGSERLSGEGGKKYFTKCLLNRIHIYETVYESQKLKRKDFFFMILDFLNTIFNISHCFVFFSMYSIAVVFLRCVLLSISARIKQFISYFWKCT